MWHEKLTMPGFITLSREEERELIARAQAGDAAARERIVLDHRPLVLSTMRVFVGYTHLRREDFFQEGMIGLLEALRRFDPAHGTRFSTYAQHWVRYYIGRHRLLTRTPITSNGTRAVRHAHKVIGRIDDKLRAKLQREPTTAELAAAMGIPEAAVVEVMRERYAVSRPIAHHDADPAAHDEHHIVVDAQTPAALAETHETAALCAAFADDVLVQLTPRERLIIEARLYRDDASEPYRNIGARLGLSGERIRQIEVKVLERLRRAFENRRPEALALLRSA